MVKLLAVNLDDDAAERVRLSHASAIQELQVAELVDAKIITAELADGVATPIAHSLGRVPKLIQPSIVRGATATGRIVESRSATYDRKTYVILTATGYGATIQLELLVV